jgi:chromosome segregation ATPase
MNKTLKAADEVKKLHRMFAALGEVVEVLDTVGNLEQAEGEAKARIEKLNREADGARATGDKIKVAANQYADEKRAEADAVLSAARQDAEALKTKALQIVADAEAKAQQIAADTTARVADAETHAAEAAARRSAAQNELDDITKRLEKAQAQVNKLLGG